MTLDLDQAIEFVRTERELLQHAAAGYSHENWNEWRRKRDEANAAAVRRLTALGAVIRDDSRGTAIKFLGIRCTCTGGISGALANWLTRAAREDRK